LPQIWQHIECPDKDVVHQQLLTFNQAIHAETPFQPAELQACLGNTLEALHQQNGYDVTTQLFCHTEHKSEL
jgi:hypothetical protein